MVAFSQVKPNTIKLKALPNFPSRVDVGPGLSFERESGVYNFELDFSNLDKITSVPDDDLSHVYAAGWDDLNGVFELFSITELKGLQGDAGPASPTDFGTVALVEGATVSVLVDHIRTAGYYVEGDGGGALYKRVVSEPATGGKIQSADGAWWALSETRPNILQFGAKGDGVTVNTTALQTALDSGSHIFDITESGTFLTARLVVPTTIQIICGAATLKATGSMSAAQAWIDITSNINITIRDIRIDISPVTYAGHGAIAFVSCASVLVQNLKYANAGNFGIQIVGGADITIEDCDFLNFAQCAVSATGAAFVNIYRNRISGPPVGGGHNIDILDCSDVSVVGNYSTGSLGGWPISYQNVAGGRILNNEVYESVGEGIVAGVGSTDIEIAGNIWKSTVSVDYAMSFGGTDAAKIAFRLNIHDNFILGAYKSGIAFAGWIKDSIIANNQITDCNVANGSPNGDGIELAGTGSDPDSCIRNVVYNNVIKNISGHMRYGVKEYTDANFNQVSNNFFTGMVTANVGLLGVSSAQSGNVTLP